MVEEKNDISFQSKRPPVRTAADLQRLRLERLLEHPDKPIIIPERPPERAFPDPPEFVRNVMGSSAGAGSGEFHVYRHIRRREYARQRFIAAQAKREELDAEFQQRLIHNKELAEKRTAKKRQKRLKLKEKRKKLKLLKPVSENNNINASSHETSSEDEENCTQNVIENDFSDENNIKSK